MPWPTKTEATAKNEDLKSRPEGGSGKIDMLKEWTNTLKSKFYCIAWSHTEIQALREGDLLTPN